MLLGRVLGPWPAILVTGSVGGGWRVGASGGARGGLGARLCRKAWWGGSAPPQLGGGGAPHHDITHEKNSFGAEKKLDLKIGAFRVLGIQSTPHWGRGEYDREQLIAEGKNPARKNVGQILEMPEKFWPPN